MNSVQLFRLLQGHAAVINDLAVQLYNGKIDKETAAAKAGEEIEKAGEALTHGQIIQ